MSVLKSAERQSLEAKTLVYWGVSSTFNQRIPEGEMTTQEALQTLNNSNEFLGPERKLKPAVQQLTTKIIMGRGRKKKVIPIQNVTPLRKV